MNAMMGADMTCPKCAGDMRSYERGGVIVDQCRDCRGIFLDRGELERLMDLESGSSGPGPRTPPTAGRSGHDRPHAIERGHADRRRDERLDAGELGELGGFGGLGELADLGELLGGRGSRRPGDDHRRAPGSAPVDPRGPQPPKKRGGLFRELLEGLGE